jgi:hypothetical protein
MIIELENKPDAGLSSKIPDLKFEIFVGHLFNVEANGGNCCHHLTNLKTKQIYNRENGGAAEWEACLLPVIKICGSNFCVVKNLKRGLLNGLEVQWLHC